MNNATRKELKRITSKLEILQSVVQDADYEDMNSRERLEHLLSIRDDVDGFHTEIAEFQAEEQDKFDNLSESLQSSEKGEAIEQAARNLEDADAEFGDVFSLLDDADRTLVRVVAGRALYLQEEVEDAAQEISDAIQDVIDFIEEAAQ